ncbi:MAG: hypothetical protein ACK5RL_01475 [Acidimicrobiales bacterium]
MSVRHITHTGNVDDDGFLIEPTEVWHGTVAGSRVASLGGPVDPTTHLNLRFSEHELGECIYAASIEVGAPVVVDELGRFARAVERPGSRRDLGPVDTGARRAEWLRVLAERRNRPGGVPPRPHGEPAR